MARVIVDTWFAAHQGQVSEEAFRRRRETWGYPESEQGWRRSIGEADDAAALILVATDDDRVVAVAASRLIAACAEVGALYVDVPYQRLGTGRALLRATIDHYRSLCVPSLQIAVLASNDPARRFYERLGGRYSGTRDDPEGLEIVYAWDLADGG